jgi:hypothetical protein
MGQAWIYLAQCVLKAASSGSSATPKTGTIEEIQEHVDIKGEARATCCTAAFCGGSVILRQETRRKAPEDAYERKEDKSKSYEETDV